MDVIIFAITNVRLEYDELTKLPTNEEAVLQTKELEKELVVLENKLASIKSEGSTRLSKKEIDKCKDYTKELERIFRQRKKLVRKAETMSLYYSTLLTSQLVQ